MTNIELAQKLIDELKNRDDDDPRTEVRVIADFLSKDQDDLIRELEGDVKKTPDLIHGSSREPTIICKKIKLTPEQEKDLIISDEAGERWSDDMAGLTDRSKDRHVDNATQVAKYAFMLAFSLAFPKDEALIHHNRECFKMAVKQLLMED